MKGLSIAGIMILMFCFPLLLAYSDPSCNTTFKITNQECYNTSTFASIGIILGVMFCILGLVQGIPTEQKKMRDALGDRN